MSQSNFPVHLYLQNVQSFVNCLQQLRKKDNKRDRAVSSMLATFLLLLIVISAFSVIYYTVSSTPPPTNYPNVTIVGKVEGNDLTLVHRGGDPLNLDTTITITIDNKTETFLVKDYLDTESIQDGEWKSWRKNTLSSLLYDP